MAMTYTSLVSEIATITAISSSLLVAGDTNFAGIMGGVIDYAEGRIWRDLDLPVSHVVDTTSVCVAGQQTAVIDNTNVNFLTIDDLSYYTPVGTTTKRVPLIPTTVAFINAVYGDTAAAFQGEPIYFARAPTYLRVLLGPCPDQAYRLEIYGSYRPTVLSQANPTTWLTDNLPELMVAASMVFVSGYMRNYGAQADDPKMAASWEAQYIALSNSARVDSARMKVQSEAWTSKIPAPLATPPRV